MEKYDIPEENSLDSMEGLKLKTGADIIVETKPLTHKEESLKRTIIDSLKNNRELSDEIILEYFELYNAHAKKISERVCVYIENSGVSDMFDLNFWESFFEAEQKVLGEEQKKEVEVIEVVDSDEKTEINTTKSMVQNMEEVYGTVLDTVFFEGNREETNPFAEMCDFRPRISKVLIHFLFKSLTSKGFVEDKDKEDFFKLFIPTTQSGGRFVKKNNEKPYESIAIESLKEQKRKNSEIFFNKYTAQEKGEILEHVRIWQWLCGVQRSASNDMMRLGTDRFKETLLDENLVYSLGCGYCFPWDSEYNSMVTEEALLRGAENIVDTIRKYHPQKAGDVIGHSLAYALRLKEAIEMV